MSHEPSESLETILNCIMTAEEYSRITHERPYVFTLKKDDKELHYFGSPHVCDPKDQLFVEIEECFHQANPDIVCVEGVSIGAEKYPFNQKMKSASREEIIERMGEPGFTLKLAIEKGLEWHSPEPRDEDLYGYLLEKGFSKDQTFTWDVFHNLPPYNLHGKKLGFRMYVAHFIERFEQAAQWEGFEYSFDRALRLGGQILDKPIDVEHEPNAIDYIDPIPWKAKKDKQTVLNLVGRASNLFRDRKIISDIVEALQIHDRMFIVYGASHAVMQEPALKKMFELM